MKKPDFISAKQAVDYIADGSTLCTIGMTLISASETILKEIERRFLEEGHPRDLTFVHTCGQAAMKMPGGMTHLAHEGLLKRVIGGHWGQSPMMMDLISDNKVEAFNLPQGQMSNMFHSMALREPGKLSKVGLGTYIDPRIEGGKMNQRTKDRSRLTRWSSAEPIATKTETSARSKKAWSSKCCQRSWPPNAGADGSSPRSSR